MRALEKEQSVQNNEGIQIERLFVFGNFKRFENGFGRTNNSIQRRILGIGINLIFALIKKREFKLSVIVGFNPVERCNFPFCHKIYIHISPWEFSIQIGESAIIAFYPHNAFYTSISSKTRLFFHIPCATVPARQDFGATADPVLLS